MAIDDVKSFPDPARPLNERAAILDALGDIFYNGSTHLVGMSELLDRIGVARKTFYRAFESKEDLIVAYLERRHRLAKAELTDIAGSRTGSAAILSLFENLERKSESSGFRGCAFLMAAIENPKSVKIQAQARANREFLKSLFLDLLGNIADREEKAEQVLVLYQGALAGSVVSTKSGAPHFAKQVVSLLLA